MTATKLRVCAAAICATILSACGSEQVVVAFSSLPPELLEWAEDAFEARHPTIDIRWVPLAAGEALDRLRQTAADPEADLWWGAPSWLLAEAAAEGLLVSTTVSWASAVPAVMSDPQGLWTGSFMDPVVLAFSRESVSRSRAPRGWDDLRHPRWTGEVLVPDPTSTEIGAVFIGSRIATDAAATGDAEAGFDWLRRLDANVAEYVADEAGVLLRLRRGLGAVAPLRLSTAESARVDGGVVDYRVPESDTPVLVQGIARIAGGEAGEGAAAFLEWTGSAEASEGFSTHFQRMPARSDIDARGTPGWMSDALAALRPVVVPADSLAGNIAEWVERWGEVARTGLPRVF